ncbi:MAG: AtpZ/AtpI family protein [Ignavibacteria bacterium]|nr:AtpZ/AtpI family protein [Ignavibacteria bacterium]
MKEPQNYTTKFSQSYRSIGPYLGLGTQLAASIILMFFLGRWLDSELNTYPIMIIIFSFLGVFAGIYNFIKTVTNLNTKKKSGTKN